MTPDSPRARPAPFPFPFPLPLLAVLATGWCCAWLAGRVFLTGGGHYAFLVWNLFLAAIPLVWSRLLCRESRAWRFWAFAVAWLLFFPNAPYVLTDFVHLHAKAHPNVPAWFDVGLLANFGILALAFGLVSLRQVHGALERRVGTVAAALIVSACTLLAGFGIYLGRFLRWNSWDVLARPWALAADIADRFLHPFDHPRTWAFTLMYGGSLLLLYWMWRFSGTGEKGREDTAVSSGLQLGEE